MNVSHSALADLPWPFSPMGTGASRPGPWARVRWRALCFGARHGIDIVSTVRTGPAAGLRLGSMHASADYSSGRNERWVQEAVAGRLRPGSVFFDVGANVGFFTLLAARAVGPRGHVVAVEPVPDNVAALRKNLERNRVPNVTLVEAAAGRESGRGRLGLSSHPGGNSLESTGAPFDATGFVDVDIVTVDELVRRGEAPPDLVKVDTESGEAEVIEGMAEVLAAHRPAVLVELDAATTEEVDDKAAGVARLLDARGYRIERLTPSYPNRRWQVVHLWAEPPDGSTHGGGA